MCCYGLKPKPSPPPIIASLSLLSDTAEYVTSIQGHVSTSFLCMQTIYIALSLVF